MERAYHWVGAETFLKGSGRPKSYILDSGS
jgi:hypothetical protein